VEAHNKQLGQSLISAVQFSRMGDFEQMGVSRSMVAATIEHGASASEPINFGEVVNDSALWRNLLLGAAAVGALGLAWGLMPGTMSTWLNRNVLLGNEQWPQKTYLIVTNAVDGRVVLPRGDDWTLNVTVQDGSEVPEEGVEVEYRPKEGGGLFGRWSTADQMASQGERGFTMTFTNVLEPFEFRVLGGDDVTDWYDVTLVPRPTVDQLRLVLTPPEYISGEGEELPVGKGPFYAYQGSSLAVSGVSNKPLSGGVLTIGDTNIELHCDGDAFSAAVDHRQLQSGTYEISLLDTSQPEPLASKRTTRFSLKLRTDRPPVVRAKMVGVTTMVVPQAKVPLQIKLSDEFAVVSASLVYQWKMEETLLPQAPQPEGETPAEGENPAKKDAAPPEDKAQPKEDGAKSKAPAEGGADAGDSDESLGTTGDDGNDADDKPAEAKTDKQAVDDQPTKTAPPAAKEKAGEKAEKKAGNDQPPATTPAEDVPDVTGTLPLTDIQDRYGSKEIEFVLPLELADLDLKIGARMKFHVEARDNDNVSGPNVGKSEILYLRVVSEDELRVDLARREKEQRQEFERLIKDQEDMLTDTRATLTDVRGMETITDPQRRTLIEVQRRQFLTADRCRRIANQLQQLVDEVQNNRLEPKDGPFDRRLRLRVIEPLRQLAQAEEETDAGPFPDGPILTASKTLDVARRAAGQAKLRDESLDEAIAVQERIVSTMKRILAQMVTVGGYQEAVNKLYEIVREQNEVKRETIRAKLRSILEQGGVAKEPDSADDAKE